MKRNYIVTAVVLILVIIIVAAFQLHADYNATSSISSVETSSDQTSSGQLSVSAAPASTTRQESSIYILNLQNGMIVQSPLIIKGKARGYWFYEGTFPITLYDASGTIVTTGHAAALSDWTTTNFVDFQAELDFTKPATKTGAILFAKDNPSGLPQNSLESRINIEFATSTSLAATSTKSSASSSTSTRNQ